MMQFHSFSREETAAFAATLTERCSDSLFVALFGDLGAGKTAFVSGLAKGLGCTEPTSSPTFAIVNCYLSGRLTMYHYDMYRVSGWDDLETTGYFDSLEQRCVIAVEWSENIVAALPERRLDVTIRRGETENERLITVQPQGGITVENIGAGLR